jgi:hypothetical protein
MMNLKTAYGVGILVVVGKYVVCGFEKGRVESAWLLSAAVSLA